MERIFFITNRNPIPTNGAPTGFGKTFNDAPYLLRYGEATLDRPDPEKVNLPDRAPNTLEVYAEDMAAQPPVLGSNAFYKELVTCAETHDIVLYIHGYLTRFNEALAYTAQLQANYNALRDQLKAAKLPMPRPLQFVAFTWPSDGGLPTTYWNDLRDAQGSAGAVAAAFDRLRRFLIDRRAAGSPFPGRIHLMAQSMGNRVLRWGFQTFRDLMIGGSGAGRVPALFDEIILTGADEDADAFARPEKLLHLPELATSGVTVYHNPTDPVVGLSSAVRLFGRRLGLRGPSADSPLTEVDAVNVFHVMPPMGQGNNDEQHYYGRLHRPVIADILQVLAGMPGEAVKGRALREPHRWVLDDSWQPPAAQVAAGQVAVPVG